MLWKILLEFFQKNVSGIHSKIFCRKNKDFLWKFLRSFLSHISWAIFYSANLPGIAKEIHSWFLPEISLGILLKNLSWYFLSHAENSSENLPGILQEIPLGILPRKYIMDSLKNCSIEAIRKLHRYSLDSFQNCSFRFLQGLTQKKNSFISSSKISKGRFLDIALRNFS